MDSKGEVYLSPPDETGKVMTEVLWAVEKPAFLSDAQEPLS